MTTDLEARLWAVESELAVHRRMAAYLRACDTEKTPDAIASHFTADAVWEDVGRNTEFGIAHGRHAIGELFIPVPKRQPFTIHYLTNGEVTVDGSQARGRWICIEPSVIGNGTKAVWIGLSYDNDFAFEDGEWRISHLRCDTLFATPYEEGWLRTPFVSVTAVPTDPEEAP